MRIRAEERTWRCLVLLHLHRDLATRTDFALCSLQQAIRDRLDYRAKSLSQFDLIQSPIDHLAGAVLSSSLEQSRRETRRGKMRSVVESTI